MKTFNNIQEILDFAITAKGQAIKFYLYLVENAKNNATKKTFSALINEEKEHAKKLQNINIEHLSLSNSISEVRISDYINPEVDYRTLDYDEVLVIAMNREKRAFMFYDKLAQMVDDDEIRKIFSSLAKEESQHKNQFEIEYDDLMLVDN